MKSESEINAAFAERQMDVIFNPASSRAAKARAVTRLVKILWWHENTPNQSHADNPAIMTTLMMAIIIVMMAVGLLPSTLEE